MRLLGGPHSVPHLGRNWAGSGDRMPPSAESGRTGMDSTHGHSAVRRSTATRRREVCPELLPASRHHPGGQQGDAGGGVRSDPYCGVWGAALAPTVVPSRGVAPRRPVSLPLSMACAAAAYTAQCTWPGHAGGGGECSASKQGTCSSARAARGEVPDHAWIACEAARGLVSPAERRVGQSSGEERSGRRAGFAQASTGGWEELRAC